MHGLFQLHVHECLIFIDITLDVLKTHHHHVCNIRIHGPHGFEIVVKKEDPEMNKAIDKCIDVVNEEIVRHKDKQIDFKKKADYHK